MKLVLQQAYVYPAGTVPILHTRYVGILRTKYLFLGFALQKSVVNDEAQEDSAAIANIKEVYLDHFSQP